MKNIPVRRITNNEVIRVPTGRFSIRDIAGLLDGKDLAHGLHRHDFYFILAVRSGEGAHEIDFSSYVVRDNTIFFLRPGQVHRLTLKAGCTGFLLEFDQAFYHPAEANAIGRFKKAATRNLCTTESKQLEKLFAVLGSIFEEFTLKEEGYADAIKANLDVFFIEYVRRIGKPQSEPSLSTYTQDRFDELTDLLDTNVNQIKSVSQYARLMSLSLYQLNAITQAAVGKTASALIDDRILLEAKRHLLATADQVKDIANQLGYEDASYFIRFFKKHTGFSPEAFRQYFR